MPRMDIMNSLGSIIYAARLDDGVIKIGWTQRFGDRLRCLRHHDQLGIELLAFRAGTHDEEQAIHAALVDHVHHGREYYHPAHEVLTVVNDMRAALNMPPVAA